MNREQRRANGGPVPLQVPIEQPPAYGQTIDMFSWQAQVMDSPDGKVLIAASTDGRMIVRLAAINPEAAAGLAAALTAPPPTETGLVVPKPGIVLP